MIIHAHEIYLVELFTSNTEPASKKSTKMTLGKANDDSYFNIRLHPSSYTFVLNFVPFWKHIYFQIVDE